MIFRAAWRRSVLCSARYTTPIPPRPMRESMRSPARTLPGGGSGSGCGIMPIMDDAAPGHGPPLSTGILAGAWILVTGPDAGAAARLRARLAEAGAAAVELVDD